MWDYDQVKYSYIEWWTDLSFISGTLSLNAILYSAILNTLSWKTSLLNNNLVPNQNIYFPLKYYRKIEMKDVFLSYESLQKLEVLERPVMNQFWRKTERVVEAYFHKSRLLP